MARIGLSLCLWGLLAMPLAVIAQNDVPTQFPTELGGIVNTRHNMMQSTEKNDNGLTMSNYRNRYGGVCVYCHTPHGANASAAAPLWNRLLPAGSSFTTYDKLNTSSLTQTVYNPGGASLPCLSCHDGSQAVDAILNMPGAGNYSATANPGSYVPGVIVIAPDGYVRSNNHLGLNVGFRNDGTVSTAIGGLPTTCMSCHNPGGGSGPGGTGIVGDPTDFTVFMIGKDLRNDHPVGVTYPTTNGSGTDWKTPGGSKVINGALTTRFFDENANGRMDKGDIRLYDTGNGASVECASCHDPHGVWQGTAIIPTFLRKPIEGSGVCMTCHAK